MMNSASKPLRLTLVLLFALLFQVHAQQQTRPVAPEPRSAAPIAAAQQPAKHPELKFAILRDTGKGGRQQYEIGQKLSPARVTFPFEFVIMLGDNMYGGESARDFENKFEKPYEA